MNRRNQIRRNISGGVNPRSGGTTAPAGRNPNRPRMGVSGPGITGLGRGNPAGRSPGATGPAQPRPQAPMPWDLQASNDENMAFNRYNRTVAGLDAGYLRTQQNFGLEGPWADFKSNPYSEAALLQRSYDNANRGTMNSAGLQLYAGSTINRRNANTHQFDLGRDDLQKRYAEAQAQYQADRQQAFDEREAARSDAGWQRIQAGLEQPLEPEFAPAPQRNKNKKPQNKPNKGGRNKRR